VLFLFGDYGLDTSRRGLKHGSDLISVGPQVVDLIVYIVRNRERVVSKDDLIEIDEIRGRCSPSKGIWIERKIAA